VCCSESRAREAQHDDEYEIKEGHDAGNEGKLIIEGSYAGNTEDEQAE
jgi:hypothetical protein